MVKEWILAPAYDLTKCEHGYNGEHATSVNFNGNPTVEDILLVGESIKIHREKSMNILKEIASKCSKILSNDYRFLLN